MLLVEVIALGAQAGAAIDYAVVRVDDGRLSILWNRMRIIGQGPRAIEVAFLG